MANILTLIYPNTTISLPDIKQIGDHHVASMIRKMSRTVSQMTVAPSS